MRRPTRGHRITLHMQTPAGLQKLGALREASVGDTLSSLPAANPIAYGAGWSVPGETSWQASASGLILLGDSVEERGLALSALIRAQRARQYLYVVIRYPDGVEEAGQAIVSGIERQWGYRGLLEGSYSLQGVGALGSTTSEQAASGGQGETINTHALGLFPGTVRLEYEMFTEQDQAQLIYDGQVVADTGGLVSGAGTLQWEYPGSAGGGPASIDVRIYAPTSGTRWEYVIYLPA